MKNYIYVAALQPAPARPASFFAQRALRVFNTPARWMARYQSSVKGLLLDAMETERPSFVHGYVRGEDDDNAYDNGFFVVAKPAIAMHEAESGRRWMLLNDYVIRLEGDDANASEV